MNPRYLWIILALLLALGAPAPAQNPELVDFLKKFITLLQKSDAPGAAQLIKAQPDLAEQSFEACLAEYRTTAEGDTKASLLLCSQALAAGLEAIGRPGPQQTLKTAGLLPGMQPTPAAAASPGAEEKLSDEDALEVWLSLAFEFGNFKAAWGICDLVKRIGAQQLKEKAVTPTAYAESMQQLDVLEVLTDVFCGLYARAIARAEALIPKTQGEEQLNLHLCTLIAARRSEQPQVIDRHLAPTLKLLSTYQDEAQPLALFMVNSMAFERELQKNPTMAVDALLKKNDAIWKTLDGYPKVVQKSFSHGRILWEGARFWLAELADRVRTAPDQATKDLLGAAYERDLAVCRRIAESYDQVSKFWQNPEFPVGLFDVVLDRVQIELNAEKYAEAAATLDKVEPVLFGVLSECEKTSTELETALTAAIAPQQKLYPQWDLNTLKFSLVEGDISRLKARFYQLRTRLALAQGGVQKLPPARLQQAQADVEKAREAQARAARGQGSPGLDDPDWDLLRILFDQRPSGWEGSADRLLNPILNTNQKLGYRPGQIMALTYQGELKAAQGNKAAAIASLKQATELAQKHMVESGGASASRLRERYKRAFDLLTQLQLEAGGTQDAYDTLGRLQQVTSMSASASGLENSKDFRQMSTLRGQMDSLESQLVSAKSTGQPTRATEELLAKTKGEFFAALNEIRRQNPKYETMLAIRPVNFSKQQTSIPEDAALVQYFPSDDTLYIFVVTRKDFKIHKVAVKYEELRKLVVNFRNAAITQTTRALASGGQAPAVGSPDFASLQDSLVHLYAYLYEPVEKDVADKKVIAFIPTGILNYIPFPALAHKVGDKLEYLVEKKQSVTLLKSSDLDQLDNSPAKKQGSVFAIGNPDGSLPAATAEAQDIARLFGSKALIGKAATSERVVKTPAQTAYLHLATHGVLDGRDPSASYLLMSGGKLDMSQIYDMKLQGLRLVTLSACQTALGERDPGSELQSLADAFSIAGSNSVVASLWSVSDASTSQLMVEFYTQLKAGATLAAAMQTAELKLLKSPTHAHPFFWAPFVLIGDWR